MKDQKIIKKISIGLIERELKGIIPIGIATVGSGNEIYITTAHDSPNIMQEIGRLREESFRTMGAGTGKSVDIDEYDTAANSFGQMFIWDPLNKEITGAYRFAFMSRIAGNSPTSYLFRFEDKFEEKRDFTIELGRSFVNFNAKQARYALYNLWDGLGYFMYNHPEIKYFFGKVTLYPDLLEDKMDLLLNFMEEMFPSDGSVLPKKSILVKKIQLFDFKLGFKLNRQLLLKKFKEGNRKRLPPLVDAYMKLSTTMKFLGATINARFGYVVEGAILITIADVDKKTKDVHMQPFIKN